MIRNLAFPLLLISFAAPGLRAAVDVQISNNRLTVAKIEDDSFAIARIGQADRMVRSLRFPWPIVAIELLAAEEPAWGAGERIQITHSNGWRSEIALHQELPFAMLTVQVANGGADKLHASTIDLATWEVDCGVPADELRVIGSGGLSRVADAEGSYTFHAIADPATRHGLVAGWLTHERGIGTFFPKTVGGQPVVSSRIDVGSFLVHPGEERPTDVLLIGLFDDVRKGLEAYADAVADYYRIDLPEKPGVYCTWYHAGASNERDLTKNTEYAAKHLQPHGLSVVQIDDKWQRLIPKQYTIDGDSQSIQTTGPIKVFVDANESFPNGMAHMSDVIRASGMTPGIWFMPFAGNFRHPYFDANLFAKTADGSPFHDGRWSGTCIDLSSPAGLSFVRERVRRIYDWGYRYFKIDGMHTGLATRNIYVNTGYREQAFEEAKLFDPDVTPVEAYRTGLNVLREEAPDAYVLGCNVSQNMYSMGPAFGLIDAMRIGPDNNKGAVGHWKHVTLGAWHGTNLYFLNNRVWHNDPDPVYVRASNPLDRARWMCSWMAVAGALHTSSEQYDNLPADRVDLLRRCLPSHSLPARPVDYLERDQPRIWTVGNDRLCVVGLFNWEEDDPVIIERDLVDLVVDPSARYVGFEVWSDQFIDPLAGSLRRELAPASCSVLALRPAAEHPQLVSTSRHITQGLMDVEEEIWDAKRLMLQGRSNVIANDPYEMRIVTPTDSRWAVTSAISDNGALAMIDNVKDPDGCLRLQLSPTNTGSATWRVEFRND